MTLLAGAFSTTGSLANGDAWFAALSHLVSRDGSDRRESVRDARGLLIKVDIGAYQVPALLDDGRIATFVTGEPLMPGAGGTPTRDRLEDTRQVHHALSADEFSVLAKSRGVFSAAQYDRARERMVLATDRLGIRAVYYAMQDGVLVFASTLRVLEELTLLHKTIDPQGLAEQLALRYPLADRTAYANIAMALPGEVIICDAAGIHKSLYWRWQGIRPIATDVEDATRAAYDAFIDAVRIRQRNDSAAAAFLSGGLDSRCVVAALRANGTEVFSFNFSPAQSQDRGFGAQFAERAGAHHHESELDRAENAAWGFTMRRALAGSPAATRVERPMLAWSGDGGSVGVGHLHYSHAMAQLADEGDIDGSVDRYLADERIEVPRRLLTPRVRDDFASAARRGILGEVERLRVPEASQSMYYFLMQSNQRRLAQAAIEEVDLFRLELQRPFFDPGFLAIVASLPTRIRPRHEFYLRWLREFPAYVSEVPWQAYPGHEPCPVPADKALVYQWDSAAQRAVAAIVNARLKRSGWRTVQNPRFASAIMRRPVVFIATLLHGVNGHDYSYIITAAQVIQRAWDVASGRMKPTPPPDHA